MDKGLFITFEGPEGSGKTTQSRLLVEELKKRNLKVVYTREPGGTGIGEQIREILLNPVNKKMGDITELMLYEAARAQHVYELIKPSIDRGYIVISDRFKHASTSYQGYGRDLGVDMVTLLNKIATYEIEPDLTIILDVEPELGLKKAYNKSSLIYNGEVDRLEQESLEFHKKVREGYLKIAANDPDRIKVIEYGQSIEEIHKEIMGYVTPLITLN